MSEKQAATRKAMRIWHRYLGFFLVGIMAMYALSGIVLIFRSTDYFKRDYHYEEVVSTGLVEKELGEALKIRRLKVDKEEGDILYFKEGTYNKATGEAAFTLKKYPLILDKMNHLHKANTNHPLFWLNIFFGLSLFFFVISSFWMFKPTTSIFRKGIYFTIGGIVLTLILMFV